jgi:hypothetical protein
MGRVGQLAFLVSEVLAMPRDYSWLAPDRPLFQCQGKMAVIEGPQGEVVERWPCGRLLPDLCFRPNRRRVGRIYMAHWRPVHSRCVVCEQNITDARKKLYEHEIKAQGVLSSHMRKERKQRLHNCRKLADYEVLTGVTRDWLAGKMRTAEQNDDPCPHCEVRWSQMAGGWRMQMTVDRTDRTRTLSHDNLTLRCRTGNTQKGTTDARTSAIRDAYWRVIRRECRDEA